MTENNYFLILFPYYFPTIVGGILTIIVPHLWRKQHEKHSYKIKVIEELNDVFYNNLYAFNELLTKIRFKYYEPSVIDSNISSFQWVIKKDPEDVNLREFYIKIREEQRKKLAQLSTPYLKLFETDAIRDLYKKRGKLLTSIPYNLQLRCFHEMSIDKMEEMLTETEKMVKQFDSVTNAILDAYLDNFRIIKNKNWIRKIKRKLSRTKNNNS